MTALTNSSTLFEVSISVVSLIRHVAPDVAEKPPKPPGHASVSMMFVGLRTERWLKLMPSPALRNNSS
jgi:hypothetical protein